MIRTSILLLTLCMSMSASAQQWSRRSQFMVNSFLVNPAVAGTQSYSPVYMSYRSQWAGFKGAPATMMASGHTTLRNRIGVGGIFYNDDTGGLISRTGAEVVGAYHVPLNKEDAVSFGLGLSANQFRFSNSEAIAFDPTDITLNGLQDEARSYIDANFGFLVYGKKYYYGFSIPQLLRARIKFNETLDEDRNRNWRHFQFMGSYRYYINDVLDIQPSALLRFTRSTPAQVDVNVRVNYLNMAWAGLTYRHRDALALMFGASYENFVLCYSFDLTTGQARQLSPFTHEITAGYHFQRKNNRFKSGNLGPRRLDRSKLVN
jgi:type IX secretion system PorP/SprF family membrane protein